MKIEHITEMDLVQQYLQHNYPNKTVLLFNLTEVMNLECEKEFEVLKDELEELGLTPPATFFVFGYLIIETSVQIANHIIKNHSKGSFRITMYSNGICVNENL